jgi:hypothetical protein
MRTARDRVETGSGQVRRRGVSAVLVSLVLVAGIASVPAAESWRVYANERFGATADVPAGWKAGDPPENGDGLGFTSPDGEATEIVSGALNISGTVAEAMAIYTTPNDGETITYKSVGKRSVVVSGTAGERIFYRKSILTCRDQIWGSISLEYPAAKKAAYDSIVRHVAGSLHPGESGQIPDCR